MAKVCRPFSKDPSIVEVLNCEGNSQLPILPGSLLQRSDRIAWLSSARVLGILFILCAAAPLALAWLGWPGLLLLAVVLGMQFHKLTILLHECIHGSLFATRRLNIRVGILAAALAGTSFRSFQRAHMQHHRHNGSADDLEGRVYPALSQAGRGTLLRQVFGPLIPVAAWKTLKSQVAGSSSAATGDQFSEAPSWTHGGRSVLALVLAQVAMALVTSWAGKEPLLVPYYQVTAVTFGLFFSRLRGFCEHIPPHGWTRGSFIRSHRLHWLERYFLYDLGMNWHLEHHLYPTVPGYRLAEVNKHLLSLHTADSLRNSMLSTVARRIGAAPAW